MQEGGGAMKFVKACEKKIKLVFLWVRRILCAPDHFGVSIPRRVWLSLHGFVPDQYALYGLDDRGKRSQYLSEFDWYRSRWIDEPFDLFLNNKVICTEVLSPHVLVPKILAVKTKGEIVSSLQPDSLMTAKETLRLVDESGSVYLKPISAGKGKGVHRLDREGEVFFFDALAVREEEIVSLLQREDDWFLCLGMRQCDYLDDLYPESANTVRVITFRDPGTHAFKIFFAVQRIGTSSTGPVDNGSRGGLVAKVDLESGELSAARSLHSLVEHVVHPDTRAVIKGFRIPQWDEMKETVLRLARLFPYVRFIAWDVLATDEGVCVIEANASSGVNILQLWEPQRNGELGAFYRAQGVLR